LNDELIQEYKKHIDQTLIRRSLRMTLEERVQRLEQMARMRDELRRGIERARKRPGEAR
jgi:hypothetical protein